MFQARIELAKPENEKVLNYLPGSPERKAVKETLLNLAKEKLEIPLIIAGREVRTGNLGKCIIPHRHGAVIGEYHKAGEKEILAAVEAAIEAGKSWRARPWHERAAVFMKAADLLAGPWRQIVNGSCMLGQSKNVFQAEIDAACELIDFFRFNCYFASILYGEQPAHSSPGIWNRMEYRALEGFVFAATPFNFTSIAGNLPSAPALMGNGVVWKPASNAVYPAYRLIKLFQEAGLPEGVINFIPAAGTTAGPVIFESPHLAGVHFTGSTETFRTMWEQIGRSIRKYRTYPRVVGETGGKDFIVAHNSTDVKELGTALIRGAFEYQGQKCSAVSRAYIPKSIWKELKRFMLEELETVKVGGVEDFTNFMNAVIDEQAFDRIVEYISCARDSEDAEILFGGGADKTEGYFIQPTLIETTDPEFRTMQEEIFGPVLTLFVYEDEKYEETLDICDRTSPYGLTGAVFARDRNAVASAERKLVNAAGNFYINDKPTGAIVGQQPFGGSRASGTNDKAGALQNLMRWTSPRVVKENFVPRTDFRYPFMNEV